MGARFSEKVVIVLDLWAISLTPDLLFLINLWASDLLFHMVWAGNLPSISTSICSGSFSNSSANGASSRNPTLPAYHTHATSYVEMRRLPRFVWSLYTTTRAYVSSCPRTKAWCLFVSFITITQDVPRKCCQIALRRMSTPNALGIGSPTFPLFRDMRSTEGVHLDWKLPIQRTTEQGRSVASWLL